MILPGRMIFKEPADGELRVPRLMNPNIIPEETEDEAAEGSTFPLSDLLGFLDGSHVFLRHVKMQKPLSHIIVGFRRTLRYGYDHMIMIIFSLNILLLVIVGHF